MTADSQTWIQINSFSFIPIGRQWVSLVRGVSPPLTIFRSHFFFQAFHFCMEATHTHTISFCFAISYFTNIISVLNTWRYASLQRRAENYWSRNYVVCFRIFVSVFIFELNRIEWCGYVWLWVMKREGKIQRAHFYYYSYWRKQKTSFVLLLLSVFVILFRVLLFNGIESINVDTCTSLVSSLS